MDDAKSLLRDYGILGLNDGIMELFAEIRFLLRREGQLINEIDTVIGATAVYYDFTLLTYNRCHFDRVPELRVFPAN